jgi:hypothetical protein
MKLVGSADTLRTLIKRLTFPYVQTAMVASGCLIEKNTLIICQTLWFQGITTMGLWRVPFRLVGSRAANKGQFCIVILPRILFFFHIGVRKNAASEALMT